jgi:hypothetical protein
VPFSLVVYWESGLTANEMAAYGQPIIFAPVDEMNEN